LILKDLQAKFREAKGLHQSLGRGVL